jgi:hypothetical protein
MLSKATPTPGDAIGGITFALAILFSLLLFGLYLWNHFLKHVLRIFTTYIVETDNWEIDWLVLRNGGYFTYTKAQTIIVLLLNVIGVISSFLIVEILLLKWNQVPDQYYARLWG